MQLSADDRAVIASILKQYPYRFYLFGSRAKDQARRFSDVDICYKDAIPEAIVAQIKAQFDDSSLPFRVDLVGFSHMSEAFKNSIEQDLVVIDT